MPQLRYKVAKLWNSAEGTVEKHQIDEKISFSENPELVFISNLRAELQFIKLKGEVSVIMTDATVDVKVNCSLCLKEFTLTIEIPGVERSFLWEPEKYIEQSYDVFFIEQKTVTLDLNEMVRQEIILHFPLISVCSKGCKGLCPNCGKDRNTNQCKCSTDNEKELTKESHKPLSNLKELMQLTKKTAAKPQKAKKTSKKASKSQ